MRVRIYRPSKSAAQSGRAHIGKWLVEPELVTPRSPEDLMGWASAGDTNSELRRKLRFDTQEEAVAFAQRNNWDFVIEPHEQRRIQPRNYQDNFRIIRPQDEEKASRT